MGATVPNFMGSLHIITAGSPDSTLRISYEDLTAVDQLINQMRSVTSGIASDPTKTLHACRCKTA